MKSAPDPRTMPRHPPDTATVDRGLPLGRMSDALQALATDLERARDRAQEAFGGAVGGVRAVEVAPIGRHYLCALDDGRVAFLDGSFDPVADEEVRRQVAAAALAVEQVEEMIDAAECDMVASIAPRVAELVDDVAIARSVRALAAAPADLGRWRADPIRALATIDALDGAAALHTTAHTAFQLFVAVTEPLVSVQHTLSDDLVRALGDLENACGRAGISGSLAGAMGAAMDGILEGADELAARNA